MPVSSNIKTMVDLPMFELASQAPAATSALAGMTTAESRDSQFIYYLTTSTFYRYDTVNDTWQQLATPITTPVTALNLRYSRIRGFHGRVISATSSSVVIPALRGGILSGSTISILSGTGAGQDRQLTFVSESVFDAGVITGTTPSTLVDSTKKWKFNQWAGYTVGITFNTGNTQYKKILYNDATTLTVADSNLQPHDPWNNQSFVTAAPYTTPVATAGSQAHYQIMASLFTVSTPWDTVPDYTAYFTTQTGGLYLVSSAAGAPFFTLQYYDIANDMWQTKTVPQSLILAALGTDFTIERLTRVGTPLVSASGVISGTTRALNDSGLNLSLDRYANHRILITSGSGVGQNRRIVANNTGSFYVTPQFNTVPDSTSKYEVWPDYDCMFLGGGAASALYSYSPITDAWAQGPLYDTGVTATISATMNGWVPVGVSTGTIIASGVRAINPVPTAGGTGYTIGDILTCSVGGTGAQVIVTNIASGGIVTAIELVHSGTVTGFTVSVGNATTGGTGTGCTIEITSVGTTALITTATAHWFKTGDQVVFAGCAEAAWNATYTIIGVSSTTAFSVSTTATGAMSAVNSQSTTQIVDASKNWTVNEHVGRLVHLMVFGAAPTSQIRWITANTATTLTVNTIVAAVNGTSKYALYDSKAYGVDVLSRVTGRERSGWATGGSTTSLVDSTKSWIPNQWSGSFFRIEAGTGYGSRIQISSNTSSSINYTAQGFTPDFTSKYEIADTWGITGVAGITTSLTGSNMPVWTANIWAGKRVRITGGTTGLGQELTIASNLANQLTTGAGTATSADATFAILSIPARGAGIEMVWAHSATDPARRGRFIYFPRGGASNTFDIYDITTGTFTFGTIIDPQTETFTTGTSYSYDGINTIYIAKGVAATPIRIFALDINTNKVRGLVTTTLQQGTAHIGNFLEVVDAPDGTKYIYLMQNTGTIFVRGIVAPS